LALGSTGAHTIPKEFKNDRTRYVDLVAEEMIPRVAQDGLAEFCDVFCEKGVFGIEDSRKILESAKRAGLLPKIHADELSPLGGAELAAEISGMREWIAPRLVKLPPQFRQPVPIDESNEWIGVCFGNDVAEAMNKRQIIGRWVCEWD
jgi:hypothetical protein